MRMTVVLLSMCAVLMGPQGSFAQSQNVFTSPSLSVGSTASSDQPSSIPAVPRFDIWADQPRLNCSLPAIRAWQVVRNVHVQTDAASSTSTAPSAAQIVFAQRPHGDAGRTKYSVIYQATRQQPANRDAWYRVAASFYIGFLDEVRRGGDYAKIEATSPTVVMSGEVQRVYFTYWFEGKDGRKVGGAAVSAPARKGVLFYNLTFEGQGREAIESAMDDLRRQVTRGLMMRTWSLKPYLLGALIVLPLGVILLFVVKRLRMRAVLGRV